MSDWDTAASWESHHWPKLKAALLPIDARNHAESDRAFEQYQRENGLLIDVKPEPRAGRELAPSSLPSAFSR